MPYDSDGNWYDDSGMYDVHLSPWEQAHGGEPYDPNKEYEENDFDRAVEEYYNSNIPDASKEEHDTTNWYDPGSYNWLINKPGPTTSGDVDPPTGPPNAPSPPGRVNLGPLLRPFSGQFQAPNYGMSFKQLVDLIGPAPRFNAPELPTIEPWAEPTAADLYEDPSFETRRGIGEKALVNNRAAQGLLRTGGTLKDLLEYNQNFASNEWGNMRERRFSGWRGNVDATLRRGAMEQDRARSMYEPQLFEWTTRANLGTRAEDLAYDRARNAFLDDYRMYRENQNDIFDRLKWASEFGADVSR